MKIASLFKLKKPQFLQGGGKKFKGKRLVRVWKKFLKQIPREFRIVTKTHQHFLVLGESHSGKSELIKSIVEQSQNVYPFEVEYNEEEDLQVYLGPKQLIQELSLDVVKDRTIKLRRILIHLWKKLFSKGPPIVVIAYNPFLEQSKDIREVNKSARLIAGKLALLTELCKSKVTVRAALTHLDKVEGYLEFANFLKQHNIAFQIPLRSDFESEALLNALNAFKNEHLSLILTSTSAENHLKILHFFTELPKLFPKIEEFLRVLITGNGSSHIHLESLTFSSNYEPFTSFASFDWTPDTSSSIFNRHPMLKHQMGAAAVLLVCSGLILNNFYKDHQQIKLSREGIDSLVFLQSQLFVNEVIPQIEKVNQFRPQEGYLPIFPRFFKKALRETNHDLANRIRKHLLEPSLRKLMLKDGSEVNTFYMLGLIHATNQNRLGQHILRHLHDWSAALDLDEKLIKAYIRSSDTFNNQSIMIDHLDKINVSTPLSDGQLWINYFSHFQELIDQPVFTGHNFKDLHEETQRLLESFRKLKGDRHAFVVCGQLREMDSHMIEDFRKNVKILKWLEENKDMVEGFLNFVNQTCPDIPNVSKLNVSQFFVRLKEVADLTLKEARTFNFLIDDYNFSYDTAKWVKLATTHVIERLINQYKTANNDTMGDIFFNHTPQAEPETFQTFRNEFPFFPEPIVVDGRYTRLAFEKNVRYTTESLFKLLEDLPINEEDKDRFIKFVNLEVVSYANAYQDSYERVYQTCAIRTSTLEEVKEVLEKLLLPASSFHQFLNKVCHHTEVFSDETSCLSNLSEINHFRFLIPLMSQEKNGKSPFEGYQEIIRTALNDLNTDLRSSGRDTLENYLTPAARITLSILRDAPTSYTNQIVNNLTAIGVPKEYHEIFKAPIMQIYYLGINDLRKGIDSLWKESLYPQLELLVAKRPFNPQGEQLATYEEMEKLTSPNSVYWNMIKEIISPVSQSRGGQWVPRVDADLKLSDTMYRSINQIAKVSRLFWDSQGNPQPLYLKVQSLPFEAKERVYPAPIVSYLVTGEETFHNFNQSPQWHPIKIEWWKVSNSAISMELISKNDSRSYRDKKVIHSRWSFFELLNKAKGLDNNVYSWELSNDFGEDISKVALRFDESPWGFFQVDSLGGE